MNNLELTKLGPSTTEIKLGEQTILFSYKTPVAYQDSKGTFFRTNKKWSVTTSKHINQWLAGNTATLVNQDVLDNLVK